MSKGRSLCRGVRACLPACLPHAVPEYNGDGGHSSVARGIRPLPARREAGRFFFWVRCSGAALVVDLVVVVVANLTFGHVSRATTPSAVKRRE